MWISACGRVLFVVVLSFLRTCKGDDAVLCVAMETCLLPCRFSPGEDLVIHWIQKTTKQNVHSFYHKRDQLGAQDASFRGRTELFLDQIPRGNASLRLTRVTIQDKGTYRCYTGTNDGTKEQLILLDVNAPVRRVNIQQVEDGITCSSEGIYPQPHLTWSTRPPSNQSLQITTRVEPTPEQLFNISSSLTAPAADLDHICTVSSGGNNRTATWWRPTSIDGSESGATVPCRSLASHTQLIWRFNHSQVILNQTWTNHMVSQEWTRHVERPSESINLTLKDLSSDQEGMYTCELSTTEETYVTSTFVRVQKSPGGRGSSEQPSYWWIAGLVVAVLLGALVCLLVYLKVKGRTPKSRDDSEEATELNVAEDRLCPRTVQQEAAAGPLLQGKQTDSLGPETERQNEVNPLKTQQTDEDQVTPEIKESQN